MDSTLTRKLAIIATGVAVALPIAACTSQTGGKASPANSSSSSDSSESSSSESSSKSSQSSGDTLADDDGTFEITIPNGYADVAGNVTGTSDYEVAVAEEDSSAAFPTTIIITKVQHDGTSLDSIADQARSSVESSLSTTTKDTSPPFSTVDGEEYVAYETGDYDQGGDTLWSVQVITIHDDTAYLITLNASPDEDSSAREAYVELVESWKWTD